MIKPLLEVRSLSTHFFTEEGVVRAVEDVSFEIDPGEIQREMGMAVMLITHDLRVVAEIANRVAVMCAGRIVEMANGGNLFDRPLHPYTRLLLKAIPTLDPSKRKGGGPSW